MIKYLIVVLLTASLSFANTGDDVLEIYYDTPSLYLLKNNASLKYQAIKYISKKKNKIKYNELIIYTDELKKEHKFMVKHYNNVKYIEEKHPLLSLIKRKDRKVFMDLLKKNGIKYPLKLKYIFEILRDSKNIAESENTYKTLFNTKTYNDSLFSIKFQYPYFVNLFYAVCISLIGLLIIRIFFKNKLEE